MATAGCGGPGSDASPQTPASSRRLRALWLWPALSQGTGAVGAQAQDEAGLRGPDPICRPASLRRRSWEPGLLGRRAGRWWPRSWGVQCQYQAALDPVLCAPCEPCGEQSQEVPPPGGRPLGQTDEKQANGRTAVHPRAYPLAISPSSLAPRVPRQQGQPGLFSKACPHTNHCGLGLGSRGLFPPWFCPAPPRVFGQSPSGQPCAGSGGRR